MDLTGRHASLTVRDAEIGVTLISDAVLREARLETVSAPGARLVNVDLSGARIEDANLQGAVVANADMTGARLSNVNVTGMVINGADVRELFDAWRAMRKGEAE